MRIFFFTVIILSNTVGFCLPEEDSWSSSRQPYKVISDQFHKGVPDGYFALRGHVYNGFSNIPIYKAGITDYVENQYSLRSTTTDSSGYFRMLFPISDSVIFCYHEAFNEVVFRGPFQNRHLIEINFYLEDPGQIEVVFKPVIYAYNAASDLSISLKPIGGFTFTYPESDEGEWNLKTNEDGTLTDLNTEKNYPYIFWEGLGKNLDFKLKNNQLEGFLIKTDTCISFLENSLTKVGLNEKESTDFITFWGPKIIQKDFALIQFLTTEQYSESIAEISIFPTPDALLRLYMYFMPLDSPEIGLTIVPPNSGPFGQKTDTFSREGFTVVEWGGSIIEKRQIVN